MSLKAKRLGKSLCVVFSAILMGVSSVNPVLALSEKELNLWWQNSIFFYDPYSGCTPLDGETGESKGWDGSCSGVGSYSSKIAEYWSEIYDVATSNGLPWEGIVAQLIGESSFMASEVCPYNPLGLKGEPSCDGKHRTFSSYKEAFSYYVNSIVPVKAAKGKFPNDPYGYIDFLINGVPGYKYATDPDYVNKVSALVCGVQNWAKANGKPISGSGSSSNSSRTSSNTSVGRTTNSVYCSGGSGYIGNNPGPGPDYDNLIFYSQCDSRWGSYMYGKGGINGSDGTSICSSGCGPTSFAVIAANLRQDTSITPAETTDIAGKAGMHVKDSDGDWAGSSWDITSKLASYYGLSAVKISASVSTINNYLENGYMIHTSGKGSAPFTDGGHYIAIVQKLDDGKWLVGDSSKRGPKGTYDPATVISGMNSGNVWAVK